MNPMTIQCGQRRSLSLTILLACACLTGCNASSQNQSQPPPVTVTIAKPVTKRIVEWDAYTGRLEPVQFVEVRARVNGYLQSIHFKEGQIVSEGDLLFVIDPRPFEAALEQATAGRDEAKAQIAKAEAGLAQASAQRQKAAANLTLTGRRYERAKSLMAQNATAQEEVDTREGEFLQAEADVEAAKAGLADANAAIATAKAALESAKARVRSAELDLSYTNVTAPVAGRISNHRVTDGNLIGGGTATSTLLTTITSVDPIYCTFDANEQEVLKYTRLAQSGKRESSRVAKNPVFLGLVDETGFPHQGHMDFVDNRFDANTASLRARCVFPNDEQVLIPGMFARIRIPGSSAYDAVLIPDSAIGTDQSSQYVYIVVDGAIDRRVVKPGPIVDGLRVVREGLTGDESLVIEGLLQSRPGMNVETTVGSIEVVEDGLPDDYEPLPPEQWLSPEPEPQPAARETAAANAQKGVSE